LISQDQAARILATYQGREALVAQTQAQRRIVGVLAALGALLVGVGVILFFAANWNGIPRWHRFAIILVATITAYAGGYSLRFSRGYAGIGNALLLLGALLYGAGIFLIGQMFHHPADPHYGLLVWSLGILPLAYLLPHSGIAVLSSVLLVTWVWIVSFLGPERYGVSQSTMFLKTTPAAGVALYAIGRLHARFAAGRRVARPYVVTGALAAMAAFYLLVLVLTSAGGGARPTPIALLAFELGIAGVAIALVLLERGLGTGVAASVESLALLIVVGLPWIVPFGERGGSAGMVLWIVAGNLLFFLISLGAALLGVQRRDRAMVNVGLTFFALGVATRYIDVIGRYLDTSLFFIGGGALLLGGGWLVERTRRRLLHRMEATDAGA
jgi:uncharacterized membrane protein